MINSLLSRRLVDLQQLAVAAGIDIAGPKLPLASRYASAVKDYRDLAGVAWRIAPRLATVVSIDVGLRNLAFAHVQEDGKLLGWQRVQVFEDGHAPHDVADSAVAAKRLVAQLPAADLYIIEQQRHRSQGNRVIAEAVLRLAILEAQLHVLLPSAIAISPARVARYLGLLIGREKKRAVVALVEQWLQNDRMMVGGAASSSRDRVKARHASQPAQPIEDHAATEKSGRRKPVATAPSVPLPLAVTLSVPDALGDVLFAHKKQDDLCDCLVQAIAVLNWSHERQRAAREARSVCPPEGCFVCRDSQLINTERP